MIERLAHYRIRRKLGEGAMGVIYEGVDDNLRMPVAIKVLAPSVAADEENLHRFEREAQAAANLKHPNIAHVFYIGRTDDNLPFYAMEFIDGIGLDTIIKKRMHTTGRQMLSIMQQTVKALGFAASKGVMHRDIKPGNIMIAGDGTVKLVDFGLVKLKEADANLTQTGIALGTPNYLCPELAQGLPGDFRSDMYSAGITFFELLTGVLPFPGETAMAVLVRQINDPVPDIRGLNNQYPRRLTGIIQRMMAKRPEDRYPSYDDILVDLHRVLADEGDLLAACWGFCQTCKVNTQVVGSNRCTVCNQEISPPAKTEATYTVRLVGFADDGAKARVSEYMKARTQKAPEQIRRMLQHVPLVLGTRVPHKQASMLKMKLYELGGLVELERCGLRHEQRDNEPKALDIQPPEALHEGTARLVTPPAKPVATSRPPVTMGLLFILLPLLVLALFLFFFNADDGPSPPPGIDTGAAPATAGQPQPEPAAADDTAEPAPAGERFFTATSPLEYVTIRSLGVGDTASIETLARTLESDLSRLQMDVGTLPLRRYTLVLDAGVAPVENDRLALAARLFADRTEMAAQGMSPSDEALRRAAWVQFGRMMARSVAEEHTPLWLELGLAGFVLHRLAGEAELLAQPKGSLAPPWDAATLQKELTVNGPATLTLLGGFVSYLIEAHSFRQVILWLERHRLSPENQRNFDAAFGMSRDAAWNHWRSGGVAE